MSFRVALAALFFGIGLQAQTCTSVTLNNTGAFANAASSNGTFTITGTPANCVKSASSNVPWISISFGGGTANPSTIGYSVQANTSPAQRVGTITVNGGLATFSVTQAGISCNYNISPSSATISADGGTGNPNVTTTSECSWTAASTVPWITATGGATGNGIDCSGFARLLHRWIGAIGGLILPNLSFAAAPGTAASGPCCSAHSRVPPQPGTVRP